MERRGIKMKIIYRVVIMDDLMLYIYIYIYLMLYIYHSCQPSGYDPDSPGETTFL